MLEHCDFASRTATRDDEGRLLRPDLVVQLPGGKQIVVDAKVPLDGLPRRGRGDGRRAQAGAPRAPRRQVRDHITKLGAEAYWHQFESTPEFVVMFVDEGMYRAALDQDRPLLEGARSRA